VSSVAVDAAFSGCAAYTASKAALEAWSRIAREELRPQKIRVGVIVPGATDTEVWPAESTFDRTRMSSASDIVDAIAAMLALPTRSSMERVVVAPAGGAL
jgi:NAD(P)-dependent dehydrogenase (short-subunit alcohol dehydrogenase family)